MTWVLPCLALSGLALSCATEPAPPDVPDASDPWPRTPTDETRVGLEGGPGDEPCQAHGADGDGSLAFGLSSDGDTITALSLVQNAECPLDDDATARALVHLTLGAQYVGRDARIAVWDALHDEDVSELRSALRASASLEAALADPEVARAAQTITMRFALEHLGETRSLIPDPDRGLDDTSFGVPMPSGDRTEVLLPVRLATHSGSWFWLGDVGEIRAVRVGDEIAYIRSDNFLDVFGILRGYEPAVENAVLHVPASAAPRAEIRVIAPAQLRYVAHAIAPDPRVTLDDELRYGEVFQRSLAGIALNGLLTLFPEFTRELQGLSDCGRALMAFVAESVISDFSSSLLTSDNLGDWADDFLENLVNNFNDLPACSFIWSGADWFRSFARAVGRLMAFRDMARNALDLVDLLIGHPFTFHTLEVCSVCCDGGSCADACRIASGRLECIGAGDAGSPDGGSTDAGADAGTLLPDAGMPPRDGGVPIVDGGACACTSGACCDGCSFRAAGTTCATDVATEYVCTGGTSCGDDVYVRHQDRTCSGASAACDGALAWDTPTVADNCTSDETCAAGDATCNYVASCGCACTSGTCCDGCNFRPSSTLCAATVAYEYLCAGGTSCGDDAYVREQHRYCSGSGAACDGALVWTTPTVIDDCTTSETCATGDSTCNPTASCSCACTSGACCDGCNYRPSTTVCMATVAYEYLCSAGTACGADAYVREQHRYCSGASATCDGALVWTTPTVIDDCTSTETCAPGDSTCNPTGSCSCACTTGACCDGCNYRPSSTVCAPGITTEYLCSGGTGCGADAYVRQQDRHCSGASATCDGALVWTTPTVFDDCTATETCAAGDSSCNLDAACTSCVGAYAQPFESSTLFSETMTGSQTFSDGAQFYDAGGTSYLRFTTSAHGGSGAMNLYPGSSGAAGNTTLSFNASASASERLRVRFWVYNPLGSAYTVRLARAGGTPIPVSVPGGDWFLVDQYVSSTLSTAQLVVELGLIPNGAGTGTWLFRMDDLVIERCP